MGQRKGGTLFYDSTKKYLIVFLSITVVTNVVCP